MVSAMLDLNNFFEDLQCEPIFYNSLITSPLN